MLINEELVRKVAHLSKIALTDEEILKYLEDFKKILKNIDRLKKVDTSLEMHYGSFESLRLREDIVNTFPKEKISGIKKGYFVVPKIINKED
jgi:aspartyl/glutamyl-tRNA(Asn/Gln) amidotransferase C subunit